MLRTSTGGLDVLRQILLKNVEDKFGTVCDDDELRAATVVDPRFKLLPFESDVERQKAADAVVRHMTCAVSAANTVDGVNTAQVSAPAAAAVEHSQAQQTSTPTLVNLWAKLNAAKNTLVTASTATSESARHELRLYSDEAPIAHGQCPLMWWAAIKQKYPAVTAVARRLLAVPATSVASERLFSKAGNVITKKCNLLNSAKAHRVIFCMENV